MRNRSFGGLLFLGVLLIASTGSSDATGDEPAEDTLPGMPPSEPAAVPLGPNPPKGPFVPFASDPPQAAWAYDNLSQADQEAVERALDDDDRAQRVNDGYATALSEQFEHAKAEHAQFRLGIEELDAVGIVE